MLIHKVPSNRNSRTCYPILVRSSFLLKQPTRSLHSDRKDSAALGGWVHRVSHKNKITSKKFPMWINNRRCLPAVYQPRPHLDPACWATLAKVKCYDVRCRYRQLAGLRDTEDPFAGQGQSMENGALGTRGRQRRTGTFPIHLDSRPCPGICRANIHTRREYPSGEGQDYRNSRSSCMRPSGASIVIEPHRHAAVRSG